MRKVIDLTLIIREHFRWHAKLYPFHTFADSCFMHQFLDLNLHGFTHVDALLHFTPGALSIDQMPLDKYMGEAAIVDLSHLGENDSVTAAELEKHAQHVKADDIVLLRTDWPLKCDYMSREFWTKAPYTARDACEWLLERKVKAVGEDYPPDYVVRHKAVDPQYKDKAEDQTTHDVLLRQGIGLIEYLCNLHLITKERVQFMALPLPIEGGDGSPVRAIAIEE